MKKFFRRIKFETSYRFGSPPWDSGISPPELYDFIASHSPARAIDIGCGSGTNLITLANAGWQVAGFDFAPRAVAIAKRKTRHAGAQADIFVDDATEMKKVRGPFELALDLGCFHGIENKVDYLIQLTRILAPKGYWLLYGFFKEAPHHPGPGLVEADMARISIHGLTLISRKDGFDKKERPSAWFLFQSA